ncbi:MAG: hypothetical protein ACXVBY_18770 [Isosphaeraceae bacterium]
MKLRNAFIIPAGVKQVTRPGNSLVVAFLLVALSYGGPTTAVAAAKDHVVPDSVAGGGNNFNVWPTGDPAVDAGNVQWAVDHVRPGGVVRLKGHNKFSGVPMAFNFGTDGSVNVSRSLSVKGEVDDSGNPLAIIHGGYKPFTCDDPSVVLEIAKLRFDGARRAAIYVRQSASVTITGNVMINLLPNKELGYPIPVQYHAASGIEMGLLSCETPDPNSSICLDQPKHLGSVDISNNFIDLGIHDANGNLQDPTSVYPNSTTSGTRLDDTSFSGIVLVDCDVNASISGNTIKNTNRRAIHPLDTFGSTEIVENTIELSPFSSAAPGTASPGGSGKRNYGILALNGHRNVDGAIHGAVHTVMRNTIVLASDAGVDGPHGVAITGANGVNDAVFSENTIIYRAGARSAIVVAGGSSLVKLVRPSYTTIRHNTIDASSYVPLPGPGFPISAHLVASAADSTTIDTNTYIGDLPTYVILGVSTGVVDVSHPNTIVDTYCGTPKILFAALSSCTQP